MQSKKRIVIVSADSGMSLRLSELDTDDAIDLITIELAKQRLEGAADSCGRQPIDMLMFVDDIDVPNGGGAFERPEMQDALYSLTYAPFRVATLLRPAVAAAQGCVVIYSRTSASMARDPQDGRSADRPFRAAAHALWKCLQIEWQDENVQFLIIATAGSPSVHNITSALAFSKRWIADKYDSLLVDSDGLPLPW